MERDLQNEIDHLSSEVEELEAEKTAIPLELFFDLVFVFAITQVVSLIVHDLTGRGVFHGLILVGLMWWGWGTWTWTTNAIDLEPRATRVVMLASMLGVFIMAHAVPLAFEGKGAWVAGGYVIMRLSSTIVFVLGVRDDPVKLRALRTFLPPSALGPIAVVLGAMVGGDAQQWFWLAGLLLEVGSAVLAGRAQWTIDAGHFAERHALIMIIALGEAIIAVGVAITDEEPSWDLATLLAVGLLGVVAMWWAYFDRLQERWEHALRSSEGMETGHIARDVYSLLHYPMISGVVLYAVALEEAFLHPSDPYTPALAWIMFGALACYLLSMAAAMYRCYRAVLYERLIGVAAIGLVVGLWRSGTGKEIVLATTAILIATMTAEYWRFRTRIHPELVTQTS